MILYMYDMKKRFFGVVCLFLGVLGDFFAVLYDGQRTNTRWFTEYKITKLLFCRVSLLQIEHS